MKPSMSLPVLSIALLGAFGCETEDATTIVVDNDYPAAEAGPPIDSVTVYKVWWVTTLLPEPVAPGREGPTERTVPNDDFAYAVLAPGWDPASADPPPRLLPARSSVKLSVTRGDTLHVRVSDDTFVGNCAAGKPLTDDDAELITRRIFPAEFAGVVFDPKTCTTTQLPERDAGLDAAE
jgi:hypothetical protein